MTLRCLRLLTLTVCAALLGCTEDGPLSLREVREIQAARARWLNSSVRKAYTFEVRQSCFCPVEFVRWNTVTVVNDSVIDVRVLEGDMAVPRAMWPSFVTVERMFASLDVTDSEYLADVRATFDPQYGYPLSVEVITTPEIADGGGAIYARNLRPASGNP